MLPKVFGKKNSWVPLIVVCLVLLASLSNSFSCILFCEFTQQNVLPDRHQCCHPSQNAGQDSPIVKSQKTCPCESGQTRPELLSFIVSSDRQDEHRFKVTLMGVDVVVPVDSAVARCSARRWPPASPSYGLLSIGPAFPSGQPLRI